MQQNNSISWELGELLGNPKGTKSFSSWSEFTDFVNEMPIKTIQPFVSNFNAFAGEGFYGNVVQGLVIKQLEDAVFIFGIAIDGTLIFRKRNYPDVSTWEDPKIIIHSNNWHKIYFVTDLGELTLPKYNSNELNYGDLNNFKSLTIRPINRWTNPDFPKTNWPDGMTDGTFIVETFNGIVRQTAISKMLCIRFFFDQTNMWTEWKEY